MPFHATGIVLNIKWAFFMIFQIGTNSNIIENGKNSYHKGNITTVIGITGRLTIIAHVGR